LITKPQLQPIEIRSDASLKTRVAFFLWLTLLLISLATLALGLSGHIVALLAAPWLSLKTEAAIHATIPVLLTAVKFVTVPLLLLLTPFARHYPTFKSWTNWSNAKFHQLEGVLKIPWHLAKAVYLRPRSLWLRHPKLFFVLGASTVRIRQNLRFANIY
jgi:hypothetical protein